MPKTAINLYSVRALEESITQVLDRVGNAGYDGVQFAGEYSPLHGNPEAIAETLERHGLEVVPPHVDIAALEDDREAVLEAFDSFDIDAVVVPWLDAEHFQSTAAVDAATKRLNALAADLADDGLSLHYHNHDHEYTDLDGEWAFDRVIHGTEIGLELDVGWALIGGDDPAERIRTLGNRAELIHMKDMTTGVNPEFVKIGDGDVDMQACARAAEAVDTEWLVYEHDDPADPATSIEHGVAFLNDL